MDEQIINLLRDDIKELRKDLKDTRIEFKEDKKNILDKIDGLNKFKWKTIGSITVLMFVINMASKYIKIGE